MCQIGLRTFGRVRLMKKVRIRLVLNHSTVIDYFGNNKSSPTPCLYLGFKIHIKSLRLSSVHQYSFEQEKLFRIIKYLKEQKKCGYRKISDVLIRKGYKTVRSKKPILNNYVYSIYKNGKMRERRLGRINDTQLSGFKCWFNFY